MMKHPCKYNKKSIAASKSEEQESKGNLWK